MKYYFSEDDYNLGSYSKQTKVKHLKKRVDYDLRHVKKRLELEFNLRLDTAWITKNTFGHVFVDFIPEKKGPTIIGNYKKLFELVCDDVKYIILSKKISRNFIEKKIDDFKVLVINIDSYKTFIESFSKQEQRIKLYLFKLNPEEEKIINNWIKARHSDKFNNVKPSNEQLLEYLSLMDINSIEEFNSFRARMDNAIKNKIGNNIQKYQDELDKFKYMIKNDSVKEIELSKFLHRNPWILDFKYLEFERHETELKTKEGNIDIFISNEQFGFSKDIIFELKNPTKKITKSYRDKQAITAVVGNALSQLIHYMETQKEYHRILNGKLILGRKKESFIDIFNQYLSNIKVITFEEIADDCQIVLDAFKSDKISP